MTTRRKSGFMSGFVFVVILLVALGFAEGASQKAPQGPIKISFPIPLSGVLAESGTGNAAAAAQAVAEWNEKGGCLGRPVELIVIDDKNSPEVSVRIARDLINREKVHALAGTGASSAAMAMKNLANEYKIPFVIGSGAARPLTDKEWNRYTFRITPNTVMRAKGLVKGLAKIGKYKKWATLNWDAAWGHSMAEDFIKYYKQVVPDMEIKGQFWSPLTGETDFTPYITAILSSGAEAVQSSLTSSDLITFVSQAKNHGFFEKVAYVNDNTADVLAIWPFGNKYPEGAIGAAYYVPYLKNPENEEFLKKFNKYTNDSKNKWRSTVPLPGFHYTESYEVIQFLLLAMTKAGTTDPEAVIKAGENMTFSTPSGPVTMRAFDHQLARPIFIGKTKIIPGYPIVPMVDGLVAVPPREIMRTIEEVIADGHPGRPDLPKQFTTGFGLP